MQTRIRLVRLGRIADPSLLESKGGATSTPCFSSWNGVGGSPEAPADPYAWIDVASASA